MNANVCGVPNNIRTPGRLIDLTPLLAKSRPTYPVTERKYAIGHSQSPPLADTLSRYHKTPQAQATPNAFHRRCTSNSRMNGSAYVGLYIRAPSETPVSSALSRTKPKTKARESNAPTELFCAVT